MLSSTSTGAPLVRLEPVADLDADQDAADADGTAEPEGAGPDLDLPQAANAASARARATRGREDLAAILMGYDIDAQTNGSVIDDYLLARDELLAAGEDVVTDELELLGLFADFAELSRNRPAGEELQTELRVHSSREHFHTYMQTLDVDRCCARKIRKTASSSSGVRSQSVTP